MSGETLTLPNSGVTVIVGPNNAGKSTFLRELSSHVKHGSRLRQYGTPKSVYGVQLRHTGTLADTFAWFAQHAKEHEPNPGDKYFKAPGGNISQHSLREIFSNSEIETGVEEASELLCLFGDPWQRPGYITSQDKRDRQSSPASHPLHILQDRPDLVREIDSISQQVFGQGLTLDGIGRTLILRVGKSELPSPKVDEVTEEYWADIERLPELIEQGDGMKSLIGLMMPLVTASHEVVLIDEPEAFLHPPQAFTLGKILGEMSHSNGTQVILATHDRNILSGILQSGSDVSIIRLDRNREGGSIAHQLNVEDLKQIWEDPVLRYTNVLDGLFHKAVILAEAERDCNFYASALDCLPQEGTTRTLPRDILFVPAGGKDGFPRLVRLLRSAKVPVVVSPDLDILNDRSKLRTLVQAMDADWNALDGYYNRATAQFRQPPDKTVIRDVLQPLNSLLGDRQSEPYTAMVRKEISAQLRTKESPWARIKLYGELAFQTERAAASDLLQGLRQAGIVPVHVGELECFARSVDVAKGPAWLPAALTAGAHKGEDTRRHLRALLDATSRDSR
ncbi:ATP-dependent endonuclease [Streptomyces sp. NPDC056460]|uniref:ATP-dependent nuclease n=1 Tax=Streptomyces sp. NPDC056460 TaxID=3345825 RepID=UPI0036B96572